MKNKIVALMLTVIVAFSFTGCSDDNGIARETQSQESWAPLKRVWTGSICSEWVDTETGVHYYYTAHGGFILRVNADGTPYTD